MDRSGSNDIEETITIPNGVKVIEVYVSAYIDDNTNHYIELYVGSRSKMWFYNNTGLTYDNCMVWIGVTPNKQYTVSVSTNTREGEDCTIDTFQIRYSPEINNKTPTVTDY